MPFICKCQKIYNDKTFKFELYFDSYKSSTKCICICNMFLETTSSYNVFVVNSSTIY